MPAILSSCLCKQASVSQQLMSGFRVFARNDEAVIQSLKRTTQKSRHSDLIAKFAFIWHTSRKINES
jgi:hypothetical protein